MAFHRHAKLPLALLSAVLPILTTAAVISRNNSSCPLERDSCECGRGISNVTAYIYCRNLSSFDSLESLIAAVDFELTILHLDSLRWQTLDQLKNVPSRTLIVSNSTLNRVFLDDRNSTDSLSNHNLTTFSLESVTLSETWAWSQLEGLPELKIAFFYNSSVGSTIGRDFKTHVSPSLTVFVVSHSNVSTLEEGSFQDLEDLTHLRITHSKLTHVSRNSLPSSLKDLSLDHNQITSLPDNIFQNMTELKFVGLSHNRISTLSKSTFLPIWRTDVTIELRNNPIKCDNRLKWIVTSSDKPNINGKCRIPKSLFGKNLSDLTEADFQSSPNNRLRKTP